MVYIFMYNQNVIGHILSDVQNLFQSYWNPGEYFPRVDIVVENIVLGD